jgi:hypothetical protein
MTRANQNDISKMFSKLKYLLLIFSFSAVVGQQVPDTTYCYNISNPSYPIGKGSSIFIDGGHNNFHTINGGFYPFSKLVKQDGYNPTGITTRNITNTVLRKCKILVIVNPLHSRNASNWTLPTPSAFSDDEIDVINEWVKEGGSLLIIADHMPFAGAANKLARSFGFNFLNGFAKTSKDFWPPSVFTKDSLLLKCSVTNGGKASEDIFKIATFTGSAFSIPETATGILKFSGMHRSLQPDTAWVFNKNTPVVNLNGFYQGAIMNYGKGKIAVFGEAAMFTAQIANNVKVGINSEHAPQNAQFVLNVIHWLDNLTE